MSSLIQSVVLSLGLTNNAHMISEWECLTEAVFFESRGEGELGMELVADVILNRVAHPSFPKSVCGVVNQPRQFSYKRRSLLPTARKHVEAVARVAHRRLTGSHRHVRSTHFHATSVRPTWSRAMDVDKRHRNHVFLSPRNWRT